MALSEITPDLVPGTDEPGASPPLPTALEREPALVAMLAEAERKVESVLEDMPSAFVEARRLIGRELWPLPRPEELQAIIKIAADRDAEGPRRDLPRRFIALRLIAEDLSRAYWDPMLLDPGAIWCRAEDLRTVVEAVERLEAMLEPGPGVSSDVALEDRVYLKTVAHALAPRRDLIAAAITLAHPLVEIMEVAGADDVRERIPSLSSHECDLLRRTAAIVAGDDEGGAGIASGDDQDEHKDDDKGEDEDGDAPEDPGSDPIRCHVGLEVLTVRWLIHSDVAEWEALFREVAETPSDTPSSGHAGGAETATPATEIDGSSREDSPLRNVLLNGQDLADPSEVTDEDAVWVIDQADAEEPEGEDARFVHEAEAAPAAPGGAHDSADPAETAIHLRHLTAEQIERRCQIHKRALEHQVLYGVVSERLQKIQDEALLRRQKETTEWLAGFRRPLVASYSRLLMVVRNQVPGAPTAEASYIPDDEPGETFEQIFEKAVTHVEEQKAAEEAERAAAPERRERKARGRRIAVMVIAILGLTCVASAIWFMLPKAPPDALVFSPSEARNVISLSETRPIGTMLYAKLSGQWDPFSDEEREREVVSLARIASDRGFTSIYLVDDAGEPLAQWDPSHGPRLFTREPAK